MPWTGYGPSDKFLGEAAIVHLRALYEKPTIRINEEIDSKLRWRPTLNFAPDKFRIIAVEASEKPYPDILRITYPDIINVHVPIAVYSCCPEESYLKKEHQKDIKAMRAHGLGLITVDEDGNVTDRFGCIPLIQHISESEIEAEIKKLPKPVRLRFKEAYSKYSGNPVSGLQDATEIVEDLVHGAIQQAVKKKELAEKTLGETSATKAVTVLFTVPSISSNHGCRAGLTHFFATYRNVAHHSPKSRIQAYNKFMKCREGFRAAIDRSKEFCGVLKDAGLAPKLASS